MQIESDGDVVEITAHDGKVEYEGAWRDCPFRHEDWAYNFKEEAYLWFHPIFGAPYTMRVVSPSE